MAGRGIDTLFLQVDDKGRVDRFYRSEREQVWRDTWVNCINADRTENGTMSPLWQKLSWGIATMSDVVKILIRDERIAVRKIVAFRANGRIVWLKDLYPQKGGMYLCFFKKEDFKWSLYQVGAKSVKEMLAVGNDSSNHSELPMIAYLQVSDDGEREFVLPNF